VYPRVRINDDDDEKANFLFYHTVSLNRLTRVASSGALTGLQSYRPIMKFLLKRHILFCHLYQNTTTHINNVSPSPAYQQVVLADKAGLS